MSAITGIPTPTPTPTAISAVEWLGQECAVGVVLADAVADEEGTLDDVKFDLMTKPRLVNVLSIKPGGSPVDVRFPVGSESWISKLGLIDSCASSIPSSVPIVHV